MLNRRYFSLADFQAARHNYSKQWADLIENRPIYTRLLERALSVPEVKQYLADLHHYTTDEQMVDRLRYALVLGYGTLGQVVMEQLIGCGSIMTLLGLASLDFVPVDGEPLNSLCDAQLDILAAVATVHGYHRTPTDPSMEAFRILGNIDIPEDLRATLRYEVMDEIATIGLPVLH